MSPKWGSGPKLVQHYVCPFHFEKGYAGPKWVWNLTSDFPLWAMMEHMGWGSKPFQNHSGPFHFERGQIGPKRGLAPDLCFSILVHVGKWGQNPNPFKVILAFFILKGAKLVPNGFGTWPLLVHFVPCWKNEVGLQSFQTHFLSFSF